MAEAPELVQPITGQVNSSTDTVQGQLTGLLSKDSAYRKQAETQAAQKANSRGLQNSSMAVQAGQSAAIQSALPIAQQDAKTYSAQNLTNQGVQNKFLETQQNYNNNIATINTQADLQSGLDSQKYLAEQDRDRLASQLDLTQSQINHQQDIEKAYLQSIGSIKQTAATDAALIGRTEGLTAEQQSAAMNKVYEQANLDINYMQSVFSTPQQWSW